MGEENLGNLIPDNIAQVDIGLDAGNFVHFCF